MRAYGVFPSALLLLFFFAALPASPQPALTVDGGGTIDSRAGPLPVWGSGRTYLTDRLDAHLELHNRLSGFSMHYRAAGYFEFTSERETEGDLTELNALLLLSGFAGGRGGFSARLGRLRLDEPSGFVFRQPGDGVALQAWMPGYRARLEVAYLGLLMKNTNEALMTQQDIAALSDPSTVYAPVRGVASVELFAADLLRNDLSVWAMYFSGLGVSLPAGRWYAGLSVRGPIWGPLSQRLDVVTGAPLAAPLSLFAHFALRADFPRFADSTLTAGALYASGNTRTMSSFLPLTGDTAGVLLAAPYENLLRFSLRYDLHPFARRGPDRFAGVAPFAAARWYIRPVPGPPPLPGFVPSGGFYGTELEAGLSLRHDADPELSLSGGFFAQPGNTHSWFGRTELIVRL